MSGQDGTITVGEDSTESNIQENTSEEVSTKDLEKQEEAKLKAKFPMAGRPMSGHSVFLQKRLASRQKYFDSGDYQMAKQKSSSKCRQLATGIGYVTGDAIPTPESVPVRKTSIIQPTKFTSSSAT
uniref:Alpha-endosulfine n=2 Tax=Timema TaxID=61471 RepID=A0A7R9EHI1_9NEOP|nr:unnamed protein product [Timema cristinae]CAD7432765.1 unnamed protein product [Timema monikensis]